MARGEVDGGFEIGKGQAVLLEITVGAPAIVERFGILRIKLNGFGVIGKGQCIAPVRIGMFKIWLRDYGGFHWSRKKGGNIQVWIR